MPTKSFSIPQWSCVAIVISYVPLCKLVQYNIFESIRHLIPSGEISDHHLQSGETAVKC